MTKRTFLITGASKGIGRALSDRLARSGHHVVGLAHHGGDFPGDLVAVDLAKRDETAAVLDELTGRDAAFITGQTLFVYGGASIGKAPL